MPRIPPTSAKWYLYEISRTRLHRGEEKKIELSNFKYNWKTDLWKIFSHPSPTLEKNGRFMWRASCDLEGLAGLSGGGSGGCDGLSGPSGGPRVPGLWSMAKEGLGTLRPLGLGAHGGALRTGRPQGAWGEPTGHHCPPAQNMSKQTCRAWCGRDGADGNGLHPGLVCGG